MLPTTQDPTATHQQSVAAFMDAVAVKNPHEPEFLQAVHEVAADVLPFITREPRYSALSLMQRMIEPERVIMFRVPWVNDKGQVEVNRGYRIEMNSAIGPYKGGLRFHPTVNLSVLKFLAFEQVFKNSLTGLPLGGGKGGADFDPKGKSDQEVMRFCQSFMTELHRHIGPNTDVPAGDIGVGAREIGYLFGQYKRLRNEFTGVLTGKELSYGGSLIRPEATGYGNVYFLQEMLQTKSMAIDGLAVVISGSGNVAQFTAKKIMELGGKVLTVSDSGGFVYDEAGMDEEKWLYLCTLKNTHRGRILDYATTFNLPYFPNQMPWGVKAAIALPCATQNELALSDAKTLVQNGLVAVSEGANMPCTPEAVQWFKQNGILYAPGKASNAGGVAVSGLEMSQNSLRLQWTAAEVDNKLQDIMRHIHASCVAYGAEKPTTDYVKGANIAGFVKVADAMLAQGIV